MAYYREFNLQESEYVHRIRRIQANSPLPLLEPEISLQAFIQIMQKKSLEST